jgi:putative transposase
MSRRRSPILGKRYPLRTVCDVWRVPRSSVYALTAASATATSTAKRGPKTAQRDGEVVALIRAILATSPFHSEGHRKVRVRLRQRGVHVGKARVLRLMRIHGLLAPTRPGHVHGDPAHAGRITTDRPDELWGTDATCFWTEADGWCWFFGAIDHATDELVGWKATKRGDRWAALEPLYQGVRYAFGQLGKDVARGLTVRTDWGPQYTAHAFGAELRWLGIQHSPSFVGEPQCNGVIERFMRTLKEQCLWLHRFTDLAQAEREIGAFIERYNQEWLVERHDHCTPRAIRAKLQAAA